MKTKFAIASITAVMLLAACGNRQSASLSANPKELQTAPQAATQATTQAATQAEPVSTAQQGTSSSQSEKPIEPEKNPVGDIPDSQVFVSYTSDSGGYSFKVPEGWARTVQGSNVSFTDKFDGVSVTVEQTTDAPTAASVKNNQAAGLLKNGRAVKITDIKAVKLPGGDAVRVTLESNSDPNAVTNKQIRQENEIYYFYNNGHLAALTLWAPLGADNVDQWKLMAESFRWK